jgi:integrase
LRAHRAAQANERELAGDAWTETGHVFTSATGKPIDPRTALRAFTEAATRAGIQGATIHTLRHSAATAMLEDGVHLKAVSELLGHAGTQITADVYAHLTTATARRAMDSLGDALGL